MTAGPSPRVPSSVKGQPRRGSSSFGWSHCIDERLAPSAAGRRAPSSTLRRGRPEGIQPRRRLVDPARPGRPRLPDHEQRHAVALRLGVTRGRARHPLVHGGGEDHYDRPGLCAARSTTTRLIDHSSLWDTSIRSTAGAISRVAAVYRHDTQCQHRDKLHQTGAGPHDGTPGPPVRSRPYCAAPRPLRTTDPPDHPGRRRRTRSSTSTAPAQQIGLQVELDQSAARRRSHSAWSGRPSRAGSSRAGMPSTRPHPSVVEPPTQQRRLRVSPPAPGPAPARRAAPEPCSPPGRELQFVPRRRSPALQPRVQQGERREQHASVGCG